MYLKYGDYQHASGEVSVVINKQGIFADAGILRGVRERWDLQGRLQAESPAALSTALEDTRRGLFDPRSGRRVLL